MKPSETSKISYKRKLKFGANTVLYTFFVLGIVIFIELISVRHHHRIDTTKTGRYSLSPQTKKIIFSLDKEIKVTSFFGEREVEEQMAFEELMSQFTYHSKQIRYKNIDPDRSPGEAKRYKVTAYGTIVLETGESEQRVSEGTEEKLTNAILKITREGKKKVFFLAGHGEKEIKAMKEDGFQLAKEAVEQANYETKELMLLPNIEALKGSDVLLIAGPQKDLRDAEVHVLQDYLTDGGKVFLMMDPFETPGLKPFIEGFGVTMGEDIVIDRMSQFFGADLTMPIVSEYHEHAITKDFNLATFFPLTRSITAMEEKPEGVEVEEILSTSPESWAETNQAMLEQGEAGFDEGLDKKGPISIGVAVTVTVSRQEGDEEDGKHGSHEPEIIDQTPKTQNKTGRMVVLGDSDFASNSKINIVGNRDFFLNTISWLVEDSDLISIRPRESGGDVPTPLTQDQQQMVFLLPVIVWPAIIILIGVAVSRHRKRMR